VTKLADRLLSADFWVRLATVLAGIGMVLCGVGTFTGLRWLAWVGIGLGIPIVFIGVLLVVVVIPLLVISNRKERGNKESDH